MLTDLPPPASLPPAPPALVARVTCPDNWGTYPTMLILQGSSSTVDIRRQEALGRPYPQLGDVRITGTPLASGGLLLRIGWVANGENLILRAERRIYADTPFTSVTLSELCMDRTDGQLLVNNGPEAIPAPKTTVHPLVTSSLP